MVERTSSFYAIKFVEGPQVRYSLASQQPQMYSVKAVMKGGFNSEYSFKTKESQVTAYAVKAQELIKKEYAVTAKVVRSNEILYPVVAKTQQVNEYSLVAHKQSVIEYPISSVTYHDSIEMKDFGTSQRSTVQYISIFDTISAERTEFVSTLMNDVHMSQIKHDKRIKLIDLKAVTANDLFEMMLHQHSNAERSQMFNTAVEPHVASGLKSTRDSDNVELNESIAYRVKDSRYDVVKDAAAYRVRDAEKTNISRMSNRRMLKTQNSTVQKNINEHVADIEIAKYKQITFKDVKSMYVNDIFVAESKNQKESLYSAKPYTGGKFGDEIQIVGYGNAAFNTVKNAGNISFKVSNFNNIKSSKLSNFKVANFNNVKESKKTFYELFDFNTSNKMINSSYGLAGFNNVRKAEFSKFTKLGFNNTKISEQSNFEDASHHQEQVAKLIDNELTALSTSHTANRVVIEEALFDQQLIADIETIRVSLAHRNVDVDLVELKAIVAIREFLVEQADVTTSQLSNMYGSRLVELALSTIDRTSKIAIFEAKGSDSQGAELQIINYQKALTDYEKYVENINYERGTFERVREIDHVKHETALINRSVDAIRVDYKDATVSRELKAQCIDVKDAVNYRALHTQNTNFKTTSAPKKSLVIVDKERVLYEKVDSVDIVNIERAEYRKIEFIDIISIEKALPPFKEISNVEKEKGLLSTEQFIDHADLEKALRNKQHAIDINEIEKALVAPVEMDLTRYKTGAYATEHIIDIVDIQVATEPDRKKKKKIWLHMGKSSWLPSMKQWKTR